MKRILFALLLCVGLVALAASNALAHGGQFRGPGGAVPPGLREPSDPTPPPPPPPTGGPPVTTPPDPTAPPGPPPVTTPGPTAPPPPAATGPDVPSGHPKQGSIGYENWTFWWGNNNDGILHIKEEIYRLRASVGSTLGEMVGAKGANTDATRATEVQIKKTLIPALLWAMDPANKQAPDTESAAYIALAKVTDDPTHVDRLIAGVYTDGKPSTRNQIVAESAALSLGLLRRSEKKRQFDAKELDKVRDILFQMFEDEQLKSGRTQGFAMLALGLLGDQPTTRSDKATTAEGGGLLYAPDPSAGAMPATDRIFELLRRKYSNADLPVTVMLALALQDPQTVKPAMLEVLKDCALRGKLWKEESSELVSSYAALALGRVGTKDHIQPMLLAMSQKANTPPNVKRSAAIALGQLGQKVDGADRANVAGELIKLIEATKDESTKNFGIISLAYLVEADVRASRTDVLNAKGVKPLQFLLNTTTEGRTGQRTFGALALGLVGRVIGDQPNVMEYGDFKVNSIKALREGLEGQKMDKRSRAAFAVALGILKDSGSKKALVERVADKSEDKELRGYAAVALGMIGEPSQDVVKAIKDAMKEHSSDELRSQTAIALGILGVKDAVPLLIQEMKEADSQNVTGQVVLALARIGDERSIEPLVELLKSDRPDLTRALACAGLGLIGDLENMPSLTRISKDVNYRAAPDVINEVLTIL